MPRTHRWGPAMLYSVDGAHTLWWRTCERCGAEQQMSRPVHRRYAEPGDGRWEYVRGRAGACAPRPESED